MQNLRRKKESGRSMVEMLGVLAIIGVLSVTGVAGYKAAVRKALANNLLNQASMRATDVATKIGSGNLDSLGNDAFDGNLGGGVTMSSAVKGPDGYTDYDESDEQFTLTMEGVDEELCQQMQSMAGGSRSVVREVECVNNADGDLVAILTFNKDLSANPVASDFDGDKEGCENSGRKYCSGSNSCVALDKECGCSGTNNGCQKCDTETGSFITDDEKEGKDCTTSDGKAGTCSDGVCEETPTCLTSGSCMNNEGLCEGYYCSIENYTSIPDSVEGLECGDGRYIPGLGSVRSLDTLQSVGNYKLSSRSMMSWDAAVNYCDALKRDGLVTYGRLADYDDIENVLNLNLGVEGVWIGKTCQFSCDFSWCDRPAADTAFYAISVKFSSGAVDGQFRASEDLYALCE